MIKTFELLALLLLLYGLAGRVDLETAAATAQERPSCPPCPCDGHVMHSPTRSRLKRFAENRRSSRGAESTHRARTLV